MRLRALADGVAGDALVAAERAAVGVDDVAGLGRVGAEAGDEVAVVALRDEADVLALGLVGERQAEAAGVGAGLGLGQAAQGKAQESQLLGGGGEEEVALVLGGVGGLVQLGAGRPVDTQRVVAGGECLGPQVAGGGQEVAELDPLVAADAGDRSAAFGVAVDEVVDDGGAEALLEVEDVVGDA